MIPEISQCSPTIRSPRGALASVLLALALAGCTGSQPAATPAASPTSEPSAKSLTAEQVLKRMIDAYQTAPAYQDRGLLRLRYTENGEVQQDEGDFRIAFERPGKLSARVYELALACDGEKLRAHISDEPSGDIDNQVLVRDAPQTLTLDNLYQDQLLYRAMTAGRGGHPVQLELLLSDEPLASFVSDDARKSLTSDRLLDGAPCHHLSVIVNQGEFGLWIDPDSFILRRLDYPPDEELGIELTAEFVGASFEPPAADRFTFKTPPGAKVVELFVPPPQPLPSDLFGRRPDDFALAGLDGEKITRQSLLGNVVVLAWFQDHPGCRDNLQQLESVRQTFSHRKNVQLLAVSSDVTQTADALKETVQQWSVGLPVLRDPRLCGRDIFDVRVVPTLVVLGPDGKVHFFEERNNPELAVVLPEVINRVLEGEDIGGDIAWRRQQEQTEYERNLAAARGDLEAAAAPVTKLAEKTAPQHLLLTELWTCGELQAPGNLLVVERATGGPAILVHDGWRTIVELDAQGGVASRRELTLPEEAGISFLRSTVDADGRRWYAGAVIMGRQAHLFDEQWKLRLSYPPLEQQHSGVRDVAIADLDGADERPLELFVGFWDQHGAQAVTLDGARQWSQRKYPTVLSLAQSPPNEVGWRQLLITGDRGGVLRVNQFGNFDPEITVAGRSIHHLYSADFSANSGAVYCGLSYGRRGDLVAVGLNKNFEEAWSFSLPTGVYENELQFVASGELLGGDQIGSAAPASAACWLLVGADGSIHFVGVDGSFHDQFGYGGYISGIAAAQLGGRPVLLVAADGKVTAWAVARRPAG